MNGAGCLSPAEREAWRAVFEACRALAADAGDLACARAARAAARARKGRMPPPWERGRMAMHVELLDRLAGLPALDPAGRAESLPKTAAIAAVLDPQPRPRRRRDLDD